MRGSCLRALCLRLLALCLARGEMIPAVNQQTTLKKRPRAKMGAVSRRRLVPEVRKPTSSFWEDRRPTVRSTVARNPNGSANMRG